MTMSLSGVWPDTNFENIYLLIQQILKISLCQAPGEGEKYQGARANLEHTFLFVT